MLFKKTICFILSAVTLAGATCSVTVSAATHPKLLAGDADCDGKITVDDVTAIQMHLAALKGLGEQELLLAKNYFPDEGLTINDATNIQLYLSEFYDKQTREVGMPALIWYKNKYFPATQEYQRFLDDLMAKSNLSGTVYITRNGRLLCAASNGNESGGEMISSKTLFPIGSDSKFFCATAIMMLKEQGKLSVDDKLEKYFPEYEIGKDVTIKNLLMMRSGIRDHVNFDNSYPDSNYPIDCYFDKLSTEQTAAENKRAILDWLFTQKLKFTPDSSYSYSNSNFLLLSEIVEVVSGITYADFIKKNIFEPLDMTSSGFYEELVDEPNLAESNIEKEYLLEPYYHGVAQGAGDIVSNAIDMDKWMTSFNEYSLLSKESFDEMTTKQGKSTYGYGITIMANGCLNHGGAITSYQSFVEFYPAENYNFFIVTNDPQGLAETNRTVESITGNLINKIGVPKR